MIVNNDVTDSSSVAGDLPVLFGDLSKYLIRDVADIRVKRLVERYGEEDLEAFVVFHRADGALIDAGTGPVKALQIVDIV